MTLDKLMQASTRPFCQRQKEFVLPVALIDHGATKTVDFGYGRHIEGLNCDPDIQAISSLASQALLGQSFLGSRLLVDTVGLDPEMIRKYVRYQEKKERREEQLKFNFE
ncbi:MAG: hypothetical protein IIC50_05330 [Planctomycetes bacterium]|nr:hypothetical protein [Planctomycetota bacterium]